MSNTKKRFNHAITLAFVVDSDDVDGPTDDEAMQALEIRIVELRKSERERIDAFCSEAPYDTFQNDGDWPDRIVCVCGSAYDLPFHVSDVLDYGYDDYGYICDDCGKAFAVLASQVRGKRG